MKVLLKFVFGCFFVGGVCTYSSLADALYADNAQAILKGLLERSVQSAPANKSNFIGTSSVMNNAIYIEDSPSPEAPELPPASSEAGVNLLLEFDVASAALRPRSYALLQEAAKALANERISGRTIIINGHTDSDGSEGYNLDLSYARARAVKQFILAISDLEEQRVRVRGYGENAPVLPNSSIYNKQRNRRVQLQLL